MMSMNWVRRFSLEEMITKLRTRERIGGGWWLLLLWLWWWTGTVVPFVISVFLCQLLVSVLFLKAFEFRKFWGKKSEVRRFQDGSISEAVVWCSTSATLAQKRMICHQIVSYLLNEKFDIPIENGVVYVADQLDSLLCRHTVRLHSTSLHCGIIKEKSECGMTKTQKKYIYLFYFLIISLLLQLHIFLFFCHPSLRILFLVFILHLPLIISAYPPHFHCTLCLHRFSFSLPTFFCIFCTSFPLVAHCLNQLHHHIHLLAVKGEIFVTLVFCL